MPPLLIEENIDTMDSVKYSDNEPILKNVTGRDIHWKEVRILTYMEVKKNQIFKRVRRAG